MLVSYDMICRVARPEFVNTLAANLFEIIKSILVTLSIYVRLLSGIHFAFQYNLLDFRSGTSYKSILKR